MDRELNPDDIEKIKKINELINFVGGNAADLEGDLTRQMIETCLKMSTGTHDLGQMKLMTRALKEMRYAYSIFNQYPGRKRISIFGSARTKEDHDDYVTAKKFGAAMAQKGWMCITGAAEGIMRAGLEGAQIPSSFGLSIRLPFESTTNSLIAGDPKQITFRYFFTRKLMFLSHSDAVAAFPGGFGTQDELFEVLTLMQTGKASIMPVVLLQGKGGTYWQEWDEYVKDHLLKNGWISSEDISFYYIAPDVDAAVSHILQFYRNYHSSRYVNDLLVIRMQYALSEKQIEELNSEFAVLFDNGKIYSTPAYPEESDNLDLPRIAFEHNRRHFGTLRKLIDRINMMDEMD